MEGASTSGNYHWDVRDSINDDNDQMAAEHLMSLANEITYTETAVSHHSFGIEEIPIKGEIFTEDVREEVVTDDWVQDDGQERVEIGAEHIVVGSADFQEENDEEIILPTDQDEYTAMRPYPCDFCSRRFRKKAALMNHMVAHQNDRPFGCNLCGVRYIRRADLMNHLKVHAYVPADFDDDPHHILDLPPKSKRGRKKKVNIKVEEEEEDSWENMHSARTMTWERKTPRRQPPPLPARSPSLSPSPPPVSPPRPPPPPSDPSKPFVCLHCGVGFAREKALQSHSRVHGGESPLECNLCGELCWSKESLRSHRERAHSNKSPQMFEDQTTPYDDAEESDFSTPISDDGASSGDETISASESPRRRDNHPNNAHDSVFCSHCGVAFQRTDLLRRHMLAAHVYKKEPEPSQEDWNCEVCDETFEDALQLLAHAGSHATPNRTKKRKTTNGQNFGSKDSKIFPCDECGKTFGSRSSQQIHVRIHTGERPYACRFCWKAFADGGTLRKHERIHTGEKPYACAVCPRAFNQRVVLREHIRSHHSAHESRRSTSGKIAGFQCQVCAIPLNSSAELVQHLIEHCDTNTALKRQPKTGPRKYKRRKKIINKANMYPAPPPAMYEKRRSRQSIKTEEVIETSEIEHNITLPEEDIEPEEGGPFKCEMCDLDFKTKEGLLIHVPAHI